MEIIVKGLITVIQAYAFKVSVPHHRMVLHNKYHFKLYLNIALVFLALKINNVDLVHFVWVARDKIVHLRKKQGMLNRREFNV
jgi:hypothetical protein